MLSATRRTISATMCRRSEKAVMSRNPRSSAPSSEYRRPHCTGSPASRRFTKLMPFTTRPSLTSRQGMMRLASIGQRLLNLDTAFVKRLSDNDAFQSRVINFSEGVDIPNRRNTARRNHVQFGVLEHLTHGIDIRTFKYTIARNVCIDDEVHTETVKLAGQLNRRDL